MPEKESAALPIHDLAADPELLNDFIAESREHLTMIERCLLALDHDAKDPESLNAIFRGFHSIKGLAGFLNLGAVQEVAHEIETLLDLARTRKLAITAEHIDAILAAKDYLNRWMSELEQLVACGKEPAAPDSAGLLESISRFTDARGRDVGAALSSLAAAQEPPPGEAGEAAHSTAAGTRSIKVDIRKLDFLVDMVGEMMIAQSLVRHDPELALEGKPRLTANLGQLARITREIQRTAMAMRMIPVRPLFQKMSRLVRDLARKTGKQVELELAGEDTELDRHIVEELADPVMHMVRNAVDHGIEPPDERVRAGKNPRATVRLTAAHQGGHILITVGEDGRGLDREKIVRKARERGTIQTRSDVGGDAAAGLSDDEIFQLIFAPGFSTAETVTPVSGRGVGMDVVRKQIQKLRGKIEIQSIAGRGTTFHLKLPLTLAIIDGLLVSCAGAIYILPVFAVREMFKCTPEMLSTVEGREEMVLVRGSLLPVVRLRQRFGAPPKSGPAADGIVIVTEAENKRYALVVDELIGKQEVVIKSLTGSLRDIPGIAGASILGDGRVGLILDAEALLRWAG